MSTPRWVSDHCGRPVVSDGLAREGWPVDLWVHDLGPEDARFYQCGGFRWVEYEDGPDKWIEAELIPHVPNVGSTDGPMATVMGSQRVILP